MHEPFDPTPVVDLPSSVVLIGVYTKPAALAGGVPPSSRASDGIMAGGQAQRGHGLRKGRTREGESRAPQS